MSDWKVPWKENFTEMTVREVMAHSMESIWGIPEGRINLTFDDGVTVASSKRKIILNRSIWQMFEHTGLKIEPIENGVKLSVDNGPPLTVDSHDWDTLQRLHEVPIDHTCGVCYVMDNKPLSGKTHVKTFNNCFVAIVRHLNLTSYRSKEYLLEKVIRANSSVYNDIILNLGDFITTIDAVDIVTFMDLPQVKEILSKVENHPDSIDAAHRAMTNFVMNTDLKHPLILPNQSGSVRNTQFNQNVGPRGFVTDLDRTVYGDAIITGFFRGLRKYYDYLVESRTGAKALEASESSIRRSEYTSRRFTIQSMVVERPIAGDCGSTNYRELVMSEVYLKNMVGKWRLDEETGQLVVIDGSEKHLIGKIVKYRHVAGCTLPQRKYICTTCLGELSNNFHYHTNLAAESMLYFMRDVTQGLLSFKHEVKSVSSGEIELDPVARSWFVPLGDNQIGINPKRNLKGISMIIGEKGMRLLQDVLTSSDMNIPLSNVGELSSLNFISKEKMLNEAITIAKPDRKATLTLEFLNYMRDNHGVHSICESGDYQIDLTKWDKSQPMFFIPLKEADVMTFLKQITRIIEGTGRRKFTPETHFFELADLILDRSDCNFTILEIMSYAVSAFNPSQGNYRLARNSPNPQVVGRTELFTNRSKGQLLPYEKQSSYLVRKPQEAFGQKYGEGHPLDVQFMPQEMIIESGRDGVKP